jgi:hypothetical protein
MLEDLKLQVIGCCCMQAGLSVHSLILHTYVYIVETKCEHSLPLR